MPGSFPWTRVPARWLQAAGTGAESNAVAVTDGSDASDAEVACLAELERASRSDDNAWLLS